ncbi:MAG: SRPBCC family protein [Paracoccaceae bacterium]
MKFSTRQDIEAPIDYVFACAADFSNIEKQAMRRGIAIERTDELTEDGIGMCWKAGFSYRGKPRNIEAELTQFEAPNNIVIRSVSGGLDGDFDVEFLPLSRNRTRVHIGLQMSPKSLTARLLIQSLKFAKSSLDTRFSKRVASFGADIENRYKNSQNHRS